MSTFYMVECDFPYPEERAGFDDFYNGHISMLLTIDGFLSAQRFECMHAARAPFLAVYELRDPGVLSAPAYTSKAGPSSVSEVYRPKMKNWDRNLLTGINVIMDIPMEGWLVIIDRKVEAAPALPEEFSSLAPVGLDQTVVQRGVLSGASGEPPSTVDAKQTARDEHIIRAFRPLHPVRHPSS